MKHTPGPWSIDHTEIDSGNPMKPYPGPIVIYADASGDSICELSSRWDDEGNARLLAAAPDMHDALVLMLKAFDRLPDLLPHETEALGAGRAALAKVGQ